MNKIKLFFEAVEKHKYLFTTVVFLLIVCVIDENSVLDRVKLHRQTQQINTEILKYRKEFEESTRKLMELVSDSVSIERIAREKYFMKMPNEDIFVFEEDLENEQ